MRAMEVKEEICFKDEPLEYFPEDTSSSISCEYSALQELDGKHEKQLSTSSVSSDFLILP